MTDVVFVLVTIVFFLICGLYVRGCDWIVRSVEDLEDLEQPKSEVRP
jgi:hypothetical protein